MKTEAAVINGDYYNSVTLTLNDLFEIANVSYPGYAEALQQLSTTGLTYFESLTEYQVLIPEAGKIEKNTQLNDGDILEIPEPVMEMLGNEYDGMTEVLDDGTVKGASIELLTLKIQGVKLFEDDSSIQENIKLKAQITADDTGLFDGSIPAFYLNDVVIGDDSSSGLSSKRLIVNKSTWLTACGFDTSRNDPGEITITNVEELGKYLILK